MGTITYTNEPGIGHMNVTLPIGRVWGVKREGACLDICLARTVAIDCPLEVSILLRTNGDVDLWDTSWMTHREPNTYWHFSASWEEHGRVRRPTPGQLATLECMFLKLSPIMTLAHGGLGTALGRPVCAWAFEGQTVETMAAKYGVKPPALA